MDQGEAEQMLRDAGCGEFTATGGATAVAYLDQAERAGAANANRQWAWRYLRLMLVCVVSLALNCVLAWMIYNSAFPAAR